jgi:4-amino-4-deoxy-L-arabinose transferase-like glycosyltransferase
VTGSVALASPDVALLAEADPTRRRRRSRAEIIDLTLVAVALVGGSLLRFIDLGSVGLNSDEAVYAGQAASLAGNSHFTGLFPVVRAHPLLFQVLASPFYRHGTPDVVGRYLTAAFGMGTVVLVFLLGRVMYGRRVGAIAALLLACMPYHVVISRQILLDGPMTFFATASLLCLAVFVRTEHRRWLIMSGACLGLAALTKETAIILIGSIFVFMSLVSRYWRPVRYVLAAAAAAVGLALTYPLVTAVSGGSRSGQSYLLWQLTRRPNHSFTFYLTDIPVAMGTLLLSVAALGLILRWRRHSWRDAVLLSWMAVPFVFFEVWPVKGFPYLLVMTPAIAVLAAAPLGELIDRGQPTWRNRALGSAAILACVLSVLIPAVRDVANPSSSGLAGAGGIPGGRQAGQWIAANAPSGAQLMTIGPSMANLLEYYSGHRADGLSVSPNPLHRNPSYFPIVNPDAALRAGTYQYLVWDAFSADRSPTFGARALELVRHFDGRVVHVELASHGGKPAQPVIVIYQVIP